MGLNVLDIEIPNMFQSKYLSTRTRPRKVPTATTYFPVVATPGGWDLGNLRPDLGSYHDSKTFGLFRLPRSHQNFRVLKCTMAHAPSTYNRPITINVNDFERHILIKMCKLHFSRFSGYQKNIFFDTISILESY